MSTFKDRLQSAAAAQLQDEERVRERLFRFREKAEELVASLAGYFDDHTLFQVQTARTTLAATSAIGKAVTVDAPHLKVMHGSFLLTISGSIWTPPNSSFGVGVLKFNNNREVTFGVDDSAFYVDDENGWVARTETVRDWFASQKFRALTREDFETFLGKVFIIPSSAQG